MQFKRSLIRVLGAALILSSALPLQAKEYPPDVDYDSILPALSI